MNGGGALLLQTLHVGGLLHAYCCNAGRFVPWNNTEKRALINGLRSFLLDIAACMAPPPLQHGGAVLVKDKIWKSQPRSKLSVAPMNFGNEPASLKVETKSSICGSALLIHDFTLAQ
jgi:hypothetical protein